MPLSFEDLREIGRAEMVTRRPDLAAVVGDASEMVATAGAAMADAAVGIGAQGVRDTYLDGAEDDALTVLVLDRYGFDRIDSTQAAGQVTFTRTSGGSGLTIVAGTRVATNPDSAGAFQIFTTNIDLVFGGGVNGPLSVAAKAVVGGKTGNVKPGTILRIIDTLSDNTFTVTNAQAFLGGADREVDEDLRERARAFYKTLRRGTKEAIEFGARQVPGVKRVTATEDGVFIPTVYVSDIDGISTAQMVIDVDLELDNWRALGACINVIGGTVFSQPITVSVAVRAGVDITAMVDLIRESIAARVERLQIGDTLFRSLIVQAVRNVDPFNIVNVTVTTPAADVVPSAGQIIRSPVELVAVA